MTNKPYQIALSFAGEDRAVVEEVAAHLTARGVRVFYDYFEEAKLWGKNLYAHLSDLYQNQADFTLIFISRHYASKSWPSLERESAQARAFQEDREYILPVRLDDSDVPGILKTVGYIDMRRRSIEDVCGLIVEKINDLDRARPRHFLVDNPEKDACPPGHVSIRIPNRVASQKCVYLAPSRYTSFGEITDDLFSSYLIGFVDAYTYGSKWVLSDEWGAHRVLAPPSWLQCYGDPVYQFAPTWSENSPSALAFGNAREWSVVSPDDIKSNRLYALACNSELLERSMIQDPKAVMLLTRDSSLKQATMSQVILSEFKRLHVFIDWLSVIQRTNLDAQVLVESSPISEQTSGALKSRLARYPA